MNIEQGLLSAERHIDDGDNNSYETKQPQNILNKMKDAAWYVLLRMLFPSNEFEPFTWLAIRYAMCALRTHILWHILTVSQIINSSVARYATYTLAHIVEHVLDAFDVTQKLHNKEYCTRSNIPTDAEE